MRICCQPHITKPGVPDLLRLLLLIPATSFKQSPARRSERDSTTRHCASPSRCVSVPQCAHRTLAYVASKSTARVSTDSHVARPLVVTCDTTPSTTSSSGPWRPRIFQQCWNPTRFPETMEKGLTASLCFPGPTAAAWSGTSLAQTLWPPVI